MKINFHCNEPYQLLSLSSFNFTSYTLKKEKKNNNLYVYIYAWYEYCGRDALNAVEGIDAVEGIALVKSGGRQPPVTYL